MKSTTHILEIINQRNEMYLSVAKCIQLLACLFSPPRLVSAKKFCAWVYWKKFSRFRPIKLRDLSHVVSAAPIFLGIFSYHSFYGMTLRF